MAGELVLDSFALLAFFLEQPGAARMEELLNEAESGGSDLSISVVNVGEVIYTLQNQRGRLAGASAFTRMATWPIRMIEVDLALAQEAARIKAEQHMGYLDCFVVALAQRLAAKVVTGDPDFHRAEGIVEIEWLS